MTPDPGDGDERRGRHSPTIAMRALAVLCGLSLGWSVLVWLTDGVRTSVLGWRVSSHDATRPFLVTVGLLALTWWRWPADRRIDRFLKESFLTERGTSRAAAWTAAVVLSVSLLFGVHVASGSDSFGYVSQSAHWSAGQLSAPVETLTDDDWPASGWLVTPLGYQPAASPGTLGYTYSVGVPWMMAALRLPFGDAGPYLLTPALGALATWLCFVYVRGRAGAVPALAATWLFASSAPFLFQMMWPMSDVPVTALWLAVLVRLPARGAFHALVTGAFMAAALLIRPNLVPVAAAVWLATAAVEWDRNRPRGRIARLAALGAPVGVAAAIVAFLNWFWWGSPFQSGYGSLDGLFGWRFVPGNAVSQVRWLMQSGSWAVAVGILALPFLAWRGPSRREWWIGAALVLAVWLSYIAYGDFVDWWYLRFQLPSWAVLIGAASAAVSMAARARWPAAAPVLVLAIGVLGGLYGVRQSRLESVFRLWWGEQRYVAAAEWLQTHTPPSAVVLAMQHSGTVGYYGHRAMLRYDSVEPERLDALIDSLHTRGRPVYLLVEQWEEAEFRQRHGAVSEVGRLDWPARVQIDLDTRVRIFELPGSIDTRTVVISPQRPAPWTRLKAR